MTLIKDKGIHQFNKQGQKNAEATRENIGKVKDKIADFKAKRAKKAAEQKTMRNKAGQNAMRTMGQDGLQEIQGTASRPAVSATSAASAKTETPQTAANPLIRPDSRENGQSKQPPEMRKSPSRPLPKARSRRPLRQSGRLSQGLRR